MSYAVNSVDAAMAEALRHLSQVSTYFRDRQNNPDIANEIGRLSTMIVMKFSEGVVNTSCHERQAPLAGNWARVVGALPESSTQAQAQAQTQGLAHYISQISLAPSSLSRQSLNSDEEIECHDVASVGLPVNLPLVPCQSEAKAGVIRIHGKIARDQHTQYITTRIHEGALLEIRVEADDRTRVTFQLASAALEFMKSNHEMVKLLGYGRFGHGYHVELAEIVDWNDDLRRMNQPIRERRRLSFARKRLFAEGMTPEKWKHDVRSVAGPGAIDFLWVFNSGNATAVFNSTSIARRVLEAFETWKNARTVYSGVSVTYSSDPCEKELALVRESRANMGRGYVRRTIR
ncbi:uncharacterized protein BP01DRAFT_419111 [Aspergillus saccharolyticus JOP 1030-1]|uniref:Uncharacterized protein n=1 Tax=Aspergillus saccharolyticus JOP 1030-1 TaxID=1450539 RepID=A0A318Z800_9EURO|nr:hypothetical protein BP01DRAFT_419111 [Aspergillus saccharolyticus JOP 1030-1]PYH40893.1 hypothetical protein BP01DRAFT_419111 [Aspergillus saccharolyticus JOP 1030-1]